MNAPAFICPACHSTNSTIMLVGRATVTCVFDTFHGVVVDIAVMSRYGIETVDTENAKCGNCGHESLSVNFAKRPVNSDRNN